MLGCFSVDALNIQCFPAAGDRNKRWTTHSHDKKLPTMTVTQQPSVDSIRSSVSLESSLDIDPSSVLFAANELIKNLFDMATDSFGLKSGTSIIYASTSEVESISQGRVGQGIPYIYHPGAVTAAFDLLPAISEANVSVYSEVISILFA